MLHAALPSSTHEGLAEVLSADQLGGGKTTI